MSAIQEQSCTKSHTKEISMSIELIRSFSVEGGQKPPKKQMKDWLKKKLSSKLLNTSFSLTSFVSLNQRKLGTLQSVKGTRGFSVKLTGAFIKLEHHRQAWHA